MRTAVTALFAFVLCSCSAAAQRALLEPAIAGDHPDPSVIRVGAEYWATATSGNWAPVFPLFRSVSSPDAWKQVGSVFPTPPAWAKGDFWAPELVNDRGRILLYYTARNKNGVLCVAVATAVFPKGPYQDHGPLVCQPDGSIDSSFIRNRDGDPYLIWKEDGNSRRQPTPIWAQPLSMDGIRLEGKPLELIRNDADWEAGVVEAPFILRRGGWFYLFYAGNTCCGGRCQYAEGVARSRMLLGPWQKNPKNPILHSGNGWLCPGHGTVVGSNSSRASWLLLHAYSQTGGIYLAREAVLARLDWVNGWPISDAGKIPRANQPRVSFTDSFSRTLMPGWQWPLGKPPTIVVHNGILQLRISSAETTSLLARVVDAADYTAQVSLRSAPNANGAFAGLGVFGNSRALAIGWQLGHVVLWEQTGDRGRVVASSAAEVQLPFELKIETLQPNSPEFFWKHRSGSWRKLSPGASLDDLVSWDSGLRLGLLVTAQAATAASFMHFSQ